MSVKKQQLESYMAQLIGSKVEKEYIKTEHCHPAYLTYMQKYIMQNDRLESRLLEEVSTTSDMQMIPL